MSFQLSSSAFNDGGRIPPLYTCEGDDISPPLAWSGAPAGTKSFVLLCDDPDAPSGMFHHWAVYDISAGIDHLDEAFSPTDVSNRQAINDFGRTGYGGPCPPKGHGTHHYRFQLFALNVPSLDLSKRAKYRDVEKAAQPHVLAKTSLTGLYSRG